VRDTSCATQAARQELARCVHLRFARFGGNGWRADDIAIARSRTELATAFVCVGSVTHSADLLETLSATAPSKLRRLTIRVGSKYDTNFGAYTNYRTTPQTTERIENMLHGTRRLTLGASCSRLLTQARYLPHLTHLRLDIFPLQSLAQLVHTQARITHLYIRVLTCLDDNVHAYLQLPPPLPPPKASERTKPLPFCYCASMH
jgi:hypothetical protein